MLPREWLASSPVGQGQQGCELVHMLFATKKVSSSLGLGRLREWLASSLGPLLKNGGGESLVTSTRKVVDFCHLAVPIRLQNETTVTCDISSTQQNIVSSKMNL